MDDVKTPSSEERKSALSGLGTSRKRVEDAVCRANENGIEYRGKPQTT